VTRKPTRPETLRQAQVWEGVKHRYVLAGLCDRCAAQAAWGHQWGAGGWRVLRSPCTGCFEIVGLFAYSTTNPSSNGQAPPDPTSSGQAKPSKFDLGKMRKAASQYSADGGFQGKAEVITVPVDCPPPSSEFIRVRDDDDYWSECLTLDYAPEGGRKETYFIDTELMERGLPPEILSEAKWSRLYTVMARRGRITSLWRIKIYDKGPGQLSTKTALACADKAKRRWVRVAWRDRVGYVPHPAEGDWGEPQWTEHTFEELLGIAFQENYIDSLEHTVIRNLMGKDDV
jgi:hypothetical protein